MAIRNQANPRLLDALKQATQTLQRADIPAPEQEARWLLAAHLAVDLSHLWQATPKTPLAQPVLFASRLQQRAAHVPLARIMGRREFWRDSFLINDAVLDPRPDSEWLLEGALRMMPSPPKSILDLGTGSGALLLSALREWSDAAGLGVDYFPDALKVAQNNAQRLGLKSRVQWQQGSWLSGINTRFDLILCNPPYVSPDTVIPPAVRYDPPAALFAPQDGLQDWQTILTGLGRVMHDQSLCMGECGPDQTHALASMAQQNGLAAFSILDGQASALVPRQQVGIVAFRRA